MGDLRVEMRDHIATVTLDRPPVNAIDTATLEEIRSTFTALGEDREVRVAIFTAAGEKAFMAGVDLKMVGARPASEDTPATRVTDPAKVARDAMWAVTDCAVPVIGAINGPALGAGLAFAACCDILVASERARFGTTEINVGLLGASSTCPSSWAATRPGRCSSRVSRSRPPSSTAWGPCAPWSPPRT